MEQQGLAQTAGASPDPAPAICAAFASGEIARGLRLFHEAGGALYAFFHGYDGLGRILDTMPHDTWRKDEGVLGALVFYLVKQGRAARAQSYLSVEDFEFDKSRTFEIYPLLVAIHLGVTLDEERLATWAALERRLPVANPLLEGLYHNSMLVLFVRLRALTEARQAAHRAISCYRQAGHVYLEHFIHLHLADLDLVEGRLKTSRRALRAAEHCLAASGVKFANEQDLIETIQLALDYETGSFEHIPERANILRESLLTGDSWAELFVQLGRIAVLSRYFTQGRAAAMRDLEQFQADYARRHGGSTVVFDLLGALLFQLDWHPSEVERLFDACAGEQVQSAIGTVLRHELQVALERDAPARNPVPGPRGQIIQALQRAERSKGPTRRKWLETALRVAASEGQLAPFLEHRDVFLGLSTWLAQAGFTRGHKVLARMTSTTLRRIEATYVLPRPLEEMGLSHRQYRVVTALSTGASNKQIARQLGGSEANVKYHLTRLYRKFGASNRRDLIEIIIKYDTEMVF